MSFLNTLLGLAGHHNQQVGHAAVPAARQQAAKPQVYKTQPNGGYVPAAQNDQVDTFTMQQAQQSAPLHRGGMLHQLQVRPQMLHNGYPNLGVHDGGNLQKFLGDVGQFGNTMQGGQFNPGYTPMQNSGYGPYGQPQHSAYANPQMLDDGYYWNQ